MLLSVYTPLANVYRNKHVFDDDIPVCPRRSSPPRSLGLNTLGTATKEAVVYRRSRRPLWLANEREVGGWIRCQCVCILVCRVSTGTTPVRTTEPWNFVVVSSTSNQR